MQTVFASSCKHTSEAMRVTIQRQHGHTLSPLVHSQRRRITWCRAFQQAQQTRRPIGAAGQRLPSWTELKRACLLCYKPIKLDRPSSAPVRRPVVQPQQQQQPRAPPPSGMTPSRQSRLGHLDFDADDYDAEGVHGNKSSRSTWACARHGL